jgi:hypothetical protein
MELSRSLTRVLPRRTSVLVPSQRNAVALTVSPMLVWSRRQFSLSSGNPLPGSSGQSFGSGAPQAYFQRQSRLPTNTVIKFVPQQTAWIVERMGKFSRILSPGLAVLIPVIEVSGTSSQCCVVVGANVMAENRIRAKSKGIRGRDTKPKRNHG